MPFLLSNLINNYFILKLCDLGHLLLLINIQTYFIFVLDVTIAQEPLSTFNEKVVKKYKCFQIKKLDKNGHFNAFGRRMEA